MTPVLGHAPNLLERGEHEAIQHLCAEGSVEAFDVGVLGGIAGLDVDQGDAVLLCPLPERGADELRAVVQAQSPWGTTQLGQLRDLQRRTDAIRQPALAATWKVELQLGVDPPGAGLALAPRPQCPIHP